MVKLVKDKLQDSSIEQYKNEERAVLAKGSFRQKHVLKRLLKIMEMTSLLMNMYSV
jgi:hypothetical protein